VDVSVFPYRSLVGSLARLRIRSYIEIVSDISTLSFFPSRLVKYRWYVRASREARRQRKGDGESGEKTVADGSTKEKKKEREREKKTGGQRDEKRFALRRDRKRDSLGLVIYLKRSRAPCATARGGRDQSFGASCSRIWTWERIAVATATTTVMTKTIHPWNKRNREPRTIVTPRYDSAWPSFFVNIPCAHINVGF